jgi:uncharacterized protein (DUF58 family)
MTARFGLIPQRRLLAALLIGAGLILLASLNPAVWLVVIVYHAALLGLLVRDATRLPGRRGFTARRSLPQPFALGLRQTVQVVVSHPRAGGLEGAVADHAPLALNPSPRELTSRFDETGTIRVEYTTQPPHRGAFAFGPVDVRAWRPRGFWIRQARIPLPATAPVYPDVHPVRRYQLTLRRGVRVLPGQRRSRPPGAATAFAGLRDYTPGDDVRRISWKASARRDQPVTIEVEAERGQQAIIALDCGRLMTAPAGVLTKLDQAVNAALLLAWVAQSHGDRVGMLTFSDGVRRFAAPQRGPAQISLLNRMLYEVQPEYTEPDFGEAFAYLARRVNRRSLVVVLTDVLDPEASRDLVSHALRLGARHLVLVVAMADPEVLAARDAPISGPARAYEWAAAEELLAARRQSFEVLQRGGVLGLDVTAGTLSPSLVERYLELKERALL